MSITDVLSSENDGWDTYKYGAQSTHSLNNLSIEIKVQESFNLAHRTLSLNLKNSSSLEARKDGIKPMMAKPPQGEAEISGGADSNGDYWVEGKISFKFGGKENESKTEDNKDKEYDPPDSRDRVSEGVLHNPF